MTDLWPKLPLKEWEDTRATLHLWMQIVGKTRLALAPMQNHWWQVPSYVTTRGLATSPMPYGERTVDMELDFVDHQESCSNVMRNNAALRDHPSFKEAEPRMRALWLANAQAALEKNESTFALLSIKDLLDPKGLVAALAAKGYTVEQPE